MDDEKQSSDEGLQSQDQAVPEGGQADVTPAWHESVTDQDLDAFLTTDRGAQLRSRLVQSEVDRALGVIRSGRSPREVSTKLAELTEYSEGAARQRWESEQAATRSRVEQQQFREAWKQATPEQKAAWADEVLSQEESQQLQVPQAQARANRLWGEFTGILISKLPSEVREQAVAEVRQVAESTGNLTQATVTLVEKYLAKSMADEQSKQIIQDIKTKELPALIQAELRKQTAGALRTTDNPDLSGNASVLTTEITPEVLAEWAADPKKWDAHKEERRALLQKLYDATAR